MIVTPTCIDNNMMGAIPDTAKVSSEFLFLVLQQIDFRNIVQEGAIPSVNQGTLERVMIPITDLGHQRDIVSRWREGEASIRSANVRLEAHRRLKCEVLALATGEYH